MDFHGLTRRELQALCKKNKIPANQTNAAMADALRALSNVEGIEQLSQPQGFQTPAPPRTSQRTARKKSELLPPDAVVIELEDSAAPVSRATRRGTAARASASRRRVTSEEEEGETKEAAALEAFQSPLPTRRTAATRRATARKSTRRASEAQHDVHEKENIKPVGTESNLKMSVRRWSARLKSVDQAAEVVLPSAVTKTRRKKMAVKIGALNDEPEESTENMAELEVDTVETANFTIVESEDKTGLFRASNDLTVEATEEMTLSEENKSEVVDEEEQTGDFKSEPLLPVEVMSPSKESKLDVVDDTNTALLEKETESVGICARRSARIKSVNKAVEECISVTKSRSKKMAVKIGALTEELEDFTENMPGKMVDSVEVPFVSVDKAASYSGSKGTYLMPISMSVDQAAEVVLSSAVTKTRRKKMAVKIGALNEEPEESTENMAKLVVDTVETADSTNVEGALESEDKTGLFPILNDLTVEATEEMTLSEENKSEVVDEKELTGDFKSEPLLPAEVTSPTKESKLDVVDDTNIVLEKETESVGMSARRSARLKLVNKVVEECPSVTKSRSKKMAVKIGALTEELEDFTEKMPGKMVDTADYSNVEVPFVSVDKAASYSGSKDLHNAGGEDDSNPPVEAAEEVVLSEESKSEEADEKEETGDFKREPLPQAEVMMPSSEEIKIDVDNTSIALLEEETETVNQESFVEEETETVNQESFVGDMDEEDSHTQLPNASNVLGDSEEIKSDVVDNITIPLLEEETESVNQESFFGDMDEEDNPKQLPNAPSYLLEDGEKSVSKDFLGIIGNFSVDDSAASEQIVSNTEPNEMELTGREELKSLNPTLTDTKIEEYEQIAGLAADVSIKDTNLFVGDVPVEVVGEKLAANVNIEWSFFMSGCGDSAILSPDATSSVLTAKEHDILASNRVSESPFLLNILYEEEPSEKESERIMIVGTGKTPKKENLNANFVSKAPILFDTAETEAMLVVGTEKKTPGKDNVKKNLSANSVSTTPFNKVTEESLLVGTEKTPKKTGATPGKCNGKKTQNDADKENNGAQSLKRESVKKPLQLVVEKRVEEKRSMYQDLSLRQLKVLYKEKASGVKKTPALQPLNQNCLLGDGNI